MNKLPKTRMEIMNENKPDWSQEAKEFQPISYVIVRNDGIVQRSMLCDLCIYLDTEIEESLSLVNKLAVDVGSSYRFRKVLLKDYKNS